MPSDLFAFGTVGPPWAVTVVAKQHLANGFLI